MANPLELEYLPIFKAAALAAGHPWPGAAAAEAWNETGGMTHLLLPSPDCFNCLGIKAGHGYTGAIVAANGTEENADGSFTAPSAMSWRKYASFEECFADQIAILHRQRDVPGGPLKYQAALDAATAEEYIAAECPVWSTNRQKAADVLATYRAHLDLLG